MQEGTGATAAGGAQAAAAGAAAAGGGEAVRLPPMLERLGQKVLVTEIARLVAHEVNNHLQGIIGLADLVGEEATDPNWKASLLQIKLQAERIASLQASLGRLLQAPRRADVPQPVDIESQWREIEELMHGALTRRQVQLQVDLAANLPACHGDAAGLSQLMMLALLWHFRSLERRADWSGDRPMLSVQVTAATTDGVPELTWTSRDNGAGVPAVMKPAPSPEEHPELYDDLTTIGLLHLLQIVNAHQARLAIKSDEKEGLELQITLRCA